jgi:hypothetical protein
MFTTKLYCILGHIEIYAQKESVKPQVHEAVLEELWAYQAATIYDIFSSE